MSRIACAILLVLSVVLAGCGGGGGKSPGNDPVSGIQVSAVPGALVLRPGDTCRFTANVAGATNTAVTWSVVEEIDGGLVNSSGQYIAPSTEGTCHVRATSVEDPSKIGEAVITVSGTGTTPPGQTGVSIRITPKDIVLPPNWSYQFTAMVSGHSNTAVTWKIVEEPGGGTITQNGVYTTPNQDMTVHVTATSQADPAKSATATVLVITELPPIPFPPPPPP